MRVVERMSIAVKFFLDPNRSLGPQIWDLVRSGKIGQRWPEAQEVVLSEMEHLLLPIIMAKSSDLLRDLEKSRAINLSHTILYYILEQCLPTQTNCKPYLMSLDPSQIII